MCHPRHGATCEAMCVAQMPPYSQQRCQEHNSLDHHVAAGPLGDAASASEPGGQPPSAWGGLSLSKRLLQKNSLLMKELPGETWPSIETPTPSLAQTQGLLLPLRPSPGGENGQACLPQHPLVWCQHINTQRGTRARPQFQSWLPMRRLCRAGWAPFPMGPCGPERIRS